LNATDLSGLDQWWINDTTHFHIDQNGLITNNTFLQVGTYVIQVWVSDLLDNVQTAIFTVRVQDTTPPVWIIPPTNQMLEYGEILNIQLEAWDLSGISRWDVNDTEHFTISQNGLLTAKIPLSPGTYHIAVSVQDPYSNTQTTTITVIVVAQAPLAYPLLPAMVLGIVASVCICIIASKKFIRRPRRLGSTS